MTPPSARIAPVPAAAHGGREAARPGAVSPDVESAAGSARNECGDAECHGEAEEESSWTVRKRFFLPIIAPGLLQGKSGAVVTPMLPIFVRVDLHGSVSQVGMVTSAYSIASLLSSAPLGALLRHMPFSVSSSLALCVLMLTAAISYTSQSVAMLFVVRLVGGVAMSMWDLSRKAYTSAEVPKTMMGRIASTLAGAQKLALAAASLLSGVIAQHLETRSIFLVQIGFSGTALLLLLLHETRTSRLRRTAAEASSTPAGEACGAGPLTCARPLTNGTDQGSLLDVAQRHWRDLLGAGLFCAFLTGIRNTWMVLLPLQGHHVGVSKAAIGATIAVQRCLEAALTFSVTGYVFDRYGKKVVAVPGLIAIAGAFALLPLSHSYTAFALAPVLYSLGNGLTGGIIVTLTAGLAPAGARTQFIGLFKMVTAVGGIVLPPSLGLIADGTKSLEQAALVIAAVAVLTAVWLQVMVPEPPKARRRDAALLRTAAEPRLRTGVCDEGASEAPAAAQ